MMVGEECDLVSVLMKTPTLIGSWQVCTSGNQSFPRLTGQVQLGWGVPGPTASSLDRKGVFGGKQEKTKKK